MIGLADGAIIRTPQDAFDFLDSVIGNNKVSIAQYRRALQIVREAVDTHKKDMTKQPVSSEIRTTRWVA